MRVYTRYKPTPRRKRFRGVAGCLLVLVALGLIGYVVWRASLPMDTLPPIPGRPRERPPATNAVPPKPGAGRTNRPAPARTTTTGAPPATPFIPLPPPSPAWQPRPVRDLLEVQLALARLGISSGSIDGVAGGQTRAALLAYQRREQLPLSGQLDLATQRRLLLAAPPFAVYTLTPEDFARLLPVSRSWLGKSEQERLDFENLLELVAEKNRAHPNLIRRLNPAVNWSGLSAGAQVTVPNTGTPSAPGQAAWVHIQLGAKILEAFDAGTNLLAHFPCSIARRVEKRPLGTLHVVVVAHQPNYTFDPELFPESAEARELDRKLILPPGPNNPVGTAWIGLDRPGYGIHGTPSPELVGRTESHGCFRLANWDAEFLAQLVAVGTPVVVDR